MTERVEHDAAYGDTNYPDCPNAMNYSETIRDSHCKLLQGKTDSTFGGIYYCGTAVASGKCPIGKQEQ